MSETLPSNNFPKCDVSHCKLLSISKSGGLCSSHYQKKYRGIDPETWSTAHLSIPTCKHPGGCSGQAVSKGLCAIHAAQKRKVEATDICSEPGCDKRVSAKGLCHAHYSRIAPSSTYKGVSQSTKGHCSFAGCLLPRFGRGLCSWHYEQKRSGVELTERPPSGSFTCSFVPCGRSSGKKKHCAGHRRQLEQGQPLSILPRDVPARTKNTELCKFPECTALGNPYGAFCSRHQLRARKHGLSDEKMLELFADPRCGSCGASEGRLVIDHDHSCCAPGKKSGCGKCVRGLLCNGCNSALGMLSESVSRIESLAEYARKHSTQLQN